MLTLLGWIVLAAAIGTTSAGVFLSMPAVLFSGILMLLAVYVSTKTEITPTVTWGYPLKSLLGKQVPVSLKIGKCSGLRNVSFGKEFEVKKLRKGVEWSVEGVWSPKGAGKIRLPDVIIDYADPFGVFSKKIFYKPSEEILVLPRKGFLATTKKYVFQTLHGAHRSKVIGGTDEFVSLRDYVPGDEIRMIDWKATARTGELHVKEMVGYKRDRVLIVADLSKKSYQGNYNGRLVEDAIRLGMSHLSMSDSVGMMIACEKPVIIPMAATNSQYDRIVSAFSKQPCGGSFDMLEAAKVIEAHYPHGTNLYLLTNLLEAGNVEEGIKHLTAQSHRIITIFTYFEPSFNGLYGKQEDPIALAAEQTLRERIDEFQRSMRKKGIKVILVSEGTDPQIFLQS